MAERFTRTIDSHGTVVLTSPGCSFRIVRPQPGIVVMSLVGHDGGQFGAAVFDELRSDVVRYPPLEVFIDLSAAVGATVPVQDQWSAWFAETRPALRAVHILATGAYLGFAAALVKRWSQTGELIRVHSDGAAFTAALQRAAPSYRPT
jgi:hypothetical protein